MTGNLIVDIADEDGIIITDGNSDRCYVYFSEIPEVIKKLKERYDNNCNGVKITSMRSRGVSL